MDVPVTWRTPSLSLAPAERLETHSSRFSLCWRAHVCVQLAERTRTVIYMREREREVEAGGNGGRSALMPLLHWRFKWLVLRF